MQFLNINTREVKEVTNLRMRDGRIFYTVRGSGIKSKKFYNNNYCLVWDGDAEDGTYLKCAEGWEISHAPKQRAATKPKAKTNTTDSYSIWWQAKRNNEDAVVLVRMGDFYETYNEDARAVADLCGLTVTSQGGRDLAGFPYLALAEYLQKIIRGGHKVGICDSMGNYNPQYNPQAEPSQAEPTPSQVVEPTPEPTPEPVQPSLSTSPAQPNLQTNGVTDALSLAFMPVFQNVAAQIEKNIRSSVQSEIDALKAQARTQVTRLEVTSPQGVNAINGTFCENFEQLVQIVAAGKPLYMYGPAGCGKSYTANQIAKALGLDYYETSQAMFAHELKGYGDATGNYVQTAFYRAFVNGGLFFLDEVDASASEALVVLNNAIANKRFDFPVIGNVDAHPNFRVVAAGNTKMTGATIEYTARTMQDASFKNRFFFSTQNYDSRIEIQLAHGDESIVAFAHDLRAAAKKANITQLCSYRQIQDLAELQQACNDDVFLLRGSILQEKEADEASILYDYLEDHNNRWAKALKKCIAILKEETAW